MLVCVLPSVKAGELLVPVSSVKFSPNPNV
jgi:hypothetical protein